MSMIQLGKLCTQLRPYGRQYVISASARSLSVGSQLNQPDSTTPTKTEKEVKKSSADLPAQEIPYREFKPSFAKQLFIGRFDTDVLTYPEVLKKDEHETLHEMVHLVEKYFEEKGRIKYKITKKKQRWLSTGKGK